MKNVFIKFNYQYAKEDKREGAITYGALYNILIIGNVKQVLTKGSILFIQYKDTPKSKKINEVSVVLHDIKELTIHA